MYTGSGRLFGALLPGLSIGSSHAGNENRVLVFGGTGQPKGRAEQLLIDSGIGDTIIRNGILLSADLPPTRTARLSTDQRLMRKIRRADLGMLTALCVGIRTT